MAKLTDTEITTKCLKFVRDAQQHTVRRDQRERALTYQDYFRGGKHQWTQEEYDTYKSRGVEPITINRCKPVMKGLLGMYLQAKQDVRARPRRNGSSTVAQVWTEVMKHTQDVSYADYVYAQVFLRGGVDTEAYLKLEIDPIANVNGQPVIKPLSLWDVEVDRNAIEYNLNDSAAYVIESQWKDKDEIDAMYPDRDQEIATAVSVMDDLEGQKGSDRLVTWLTQSGDIAGDDAEFEDNQIPDVDLKRQYRYKVKRVFWKETVPAMIVGDRQSRSMAIVKDEKLIAKLKRKAGKSTRYAITLWPTKVLHETIMLGEYMLEDKPDPLGPGISDYPIVRYCPMWDEGYAVGALDDITSLNKEENIHRTQTIRLLNQTANSGWVVGSAGNEEWNRVLRNFGSVPGILIPKDKFGNSVERIVPNQLSQGHFMLGQQFELDIKRVSGVDDATQGYSTSQTESGRAIGLKQQNNRSSAECFFDNFYRTLEILGNLLLAVNIANDYYSDEEIRAIVDESSMLDSKLLAQAKAKFTATIGSDLPQPQPLPPMNPQMMLGIKPADRGRVLQTMQKGVEGATQYMKAYPQLAASYEEVIREEAKEMLLVELRADKGMYGVKVTVSPSAPTERLTQFLQMDALMSKYGNIIPPELFIDLTDLKNKDEIKAAISSNRQAQMQPPMQARPQVRAA